MRRVQRRGGAGLRSAVGDTAVAADEAAVAWFTAMDHYFQMEHFATAQDPMLEGYSVLNFVAAKTERLRLSLLVTGVTSGTSSTYCGGTATRSAAITTASRRRSSAG